MAAVATGPVSAPADGPDRDPSATTVVDGSSTRTVLLAHRTVDGRLDLAAIFEVDNARGTGGVLLLPPPTMIEVPALQTQVLADLPAFVDDDVLAVSVMNATGVRIDDAIVADDLALARLLAPADPIAVEFSRGVRIDDDSGTLGYPGGARSLPADEAYRVLLGEEPDGTLAHLVTVQAVFAGWIERLADPSIAEATRVVDARADAIVALTAVEVDYVTLPVANVDAGDDERFRIRDEAAADLVVGRFAGAALGDRDGERPKAELRNGTGTVGLTQRVASFVVPIGVEVVLTDNINGFGQATTTVVYYRDENRADAERLVRALGVGNVAKAKREVDVVDLTVIVGADFETAHPDDPPEP